MGAPLAGVTPMMALNFFGFGLGKELLQHDPTVPITLVQERVHARKGMFVIQNDVKSVLNMSHLTLSISMMCLKVKFLVLIKASLSSCS